MTKAKVAKRLPALPREIKAEYRPFDTIGPADNRYVAKPRFIAYPTNHLKGWHFVVTRIDNKGRKWLVRQYSARLTKQGGFFDVIYCRLTEE